MYGVTDIGVIYQITDEDDANLKPYLDSGLYDSSEILESLTSELPDTSLPETSLPDTSLPETSLPDTSLPETSLPVTSLPETSDNVTTVIQTYEIDYQELESAVYASIADYPIYPSSSAVSVFQSVCEGLPPQTGYVMLSGADSNTAYLYYSTEYSVSDYSISLSGDVHRCSYYRYRPTSTSSWEYRYSLTHSDDVSFMLSDSVLMYTNLVDGYPVLSSSTINKSYSSQIFSLVLISVLMIVSARIFLKGALHND